MKIDLVCQLNFDHKIWGIGIGDHYQKKRGMFVETSYLLLSVNIEYRLRQSIPVKLTGCFVTGRSGVFLSPYQHQCGNVVLLRLMWKN